MQLLGSTPNPPNLFPIGHQKGGGRIYFTQIIPSTVLAQHNKQQQQQTKAYNSNFTKNMRTFTDSVIILCFFITIFQFSSCSRQSFAFTVTHASTNIRVTSTVPRNLYPGEDPGPPMNWMQSSQSSTSKKSIPLHDKEENEVDGSNILKANRWSKYAPDASLPTEEFRNQLKENMKNDLERRRAESPNRGNQPAKCYLDSL